LTHSALREIEVDLFCSLSNGSIVPRPSGQRGEKMCFSIASVPNGVVGTVLKTAQKAASSAALTSSEYRPWRSP
jgi:hypothetical protein